VLFYSGGQSPRRPIRRRAPPVFCRQRRGKCLRRRDM